MKSRAFVLTSVLVLLIGLGWWGHSAPTATDAARRITARDARVSSAPADPVLAVQTRGTASTPFAVLPTMPALTDYRTFNPESLTVELAPGCPITYQRTLTYTKLGRTVWVGRNPELPLSLYVAAADEHTYFANIDLAPGAYGIRISDRTATILHDEQPITCGADLVHRDEAANLITATPTAPIGATTVVDISAFLETNVIAQYGEASATTQIIADIETCNQVLANSEVSTVRWNLVETISVPASILVFSGDMSLPLAQMSRRGTALGDFVQDRVTASGSDNALLYVGTTLGSYGGLGYVGAGYCVVRFDQIRYRTTAHELGHNLNCVHDRITQSETAAKPNAYNYGFMFNNARTSGGYSDTHYVGDVMSYASERLPLFANPNYIHTYTNRTTGATQTQAMGVPVGQPYPVYAARTITEFAPSLAATRTRKVQISLQPTDTQTAGGARTTFTVSGPTDATYQWFKDGVALSGATASTLAIATPSSLDEGAYTCVISAGGTSVTSSAARLTVGALAAANPSARLADISTRSLVKKNIAQIAGFIVNGGGTPRVLVRASGPALSAFGIAGALADPSMHVVDATGQTVATNDNWSASDIIDLAGRVGAFPWSTGSRDAALAPTVQCSAYTAIVTGNNGAEGVALTEVYDTSSDASQPRMIALSTRSWVGAGEEAQIAGFIIGGTGLKTVLVRAAGPALTAFGVNGVTPNPTLAIYFNNEKRFSNDNWSEPTNAADVAEKSALVGAFALTRGSNDAALLLTLPAGAYSAVVTPATNTAAGVGLVEIYEVR